MSVTVANQSIYQGTTMLQMSTRSARELVLPRMSLLLLAAGVFATLLTQIPASHPAGIPAAIKHAQLTQV